MAFYTCSSCLFSFERRGPVSDCPDCGRANIRESTAGEIEEFLRNRECERGSGKPETQG